MILRPHPQQVRHEPERFEALKEKYEGISNIEIQTDFSVTNPVMESDLLITDWSDIAWEYAFVTKRPVLYIDTPMKIMNQEYEKIGIEPVNKTLRTSLGTVVGLDELDSVCETVKQMLEHTSEYSKQIESTFKEHIYNIGRSAELCGRYIIKRLSK